MDQLAQHIWRDIRRGILKGLPTYKVGSGRTNPYSCVLNIGASCASPPLVVFDSIDHLLEREPTSWIPRDMWDNPLICESFLQVENVESLGLCEGDDMEYVELHVADSDPLWAELAHVARLTRSLLVQATPETKPVPYKHLRSVDLIYAPHDGTKPIIFYSRLNPRLISDEMAGAIAHAYIGRINSSYTEDQNEKQAKKFLAMREERAPF